MRTADCHPDRKHQAKGLCAPCYLATWNRSRPEYRAARCKKWRAENHDRWRAGAKAYYVANRERIAAREKTRRATDPTVNLRRIAAKYGLTLAERAAILAEPCAICGGIATDVDHDHATGAVRGGLCGGCNSGIGGLRDDPELVAKAAEYLAARRPLLRLLA